MKTIIKLVIAVLLCTVDLSAGNVVTKPSKDPFHLILEGKFLNEKNINCTVYVLDESKGTFVSELRTKFKRYYSFSFNVGSKYIVRFEDKNQNVKFLMVDVTKSGYFMTDVDFARKYDAKLYVTKIGYTLLPLTDSRRNPELLAKNE